MEMYCTTLTDHVLFAYYFFVQYIRIIVWEFSLSLFYAVFTLTQMGVDGRKDSVINVKADIATVCNRQGVRSEDKTWVWQ